MRGWRTSRATCAASAANTMPSAMSRRRVTSCGKRLGERLGRHGSGQAPALDDLPRLDINQIPPWPQRPHGLEAVLHHVAVELDAVAVGVGEVHAAGHVVLDRGLNGDAQRTQLAMGVL